MLIVHIQDGEHLERVAAEVGPLLPVREAAALRGCHRSSLWDRLERGSVRRFILFGHTLVGMREVMRAIGAKGARRQGRAVRSTF